MAVELATPVHEVGVIGERGDEGLGVALLVESIIRRIAVAT
jgi:hypothetical protein